MTSLESIQNSKIILLLEEVFRCFDAIIKHANDDGRYDINKNSELLVSALMTELYSYWPIKTYLDPRQPSVDLYSSNEDVLIQVTTTQTKEKLNKTILKAPSHYNNLKILIFFILAYEYEHRLESWSWAWISFFDFSKPEYILDFSSIMVKIECKYWNKNIVDLFKFSRELCNALNITYPNHEFALGALRKITQMETDYKWTWADEENNIRLTPIL